MKSKKEVAVEHFQSGFNCAQSVVAAFCEKYHMDKETALKTTSGFGAGFRSGEVCGAVSGAVMVIGLKYGQTIGEDKPTKDFCNQKTLEFTTAFEAKNKTIVCRELLGFDKSQKEEFEKAKAQNIFKETCAKIIESSVEILEELGY